VERRSAEREGSDKQIVLKQALAGAPTKHKSNILTQFNSSTALWSLGILTVVCCVHFFVSWSLFSWTSSNSATPIAIQVVVCKHEIVQLRQAQVNNMALSEVSCSAAVVNTSARVPEDAPLPVTVEEIHDKNPDVEDTDSGGWW